MKRLVGHPRGAAGGDVEALTRLVSEGYESTYAHSSPNVQRRYQRLIHALTEHGRHGHKSPLPTDDGCR